MEWKAYQSCNNSTGGPGVGKGTQCSRLAADLNLMHVSLGDLLRASADGSLDSSTAELVKYHMRDGTLVPSEQVVRILQDHIKSKLAEGRQRFLLDGFPRSMDQHCHFEKQVRLHEQLSERVSRLIYSIQVCKCKGILLLRCSRKRMLERVEKRAKISGRVDDNLETF